LNASTNILEVTGRGEQINVPSHIDGRAHAWQKVAGVEGQNVGQDVIVQEVKLPMAQVVGRRLFFAVTAYNDLNTGMIRGAHSNIVVEKVPEEMGSCNADGCHN